MRPIRAVRLLLVLAVIALSPLHGQIKDQDIDALLSNDDAVLALKQQLAAQNISKTEYGAEAAKLAQIRKEIVSRYDRAGRRELVARYRVAVRQGQLRDAEATRQAAIEEQKRRLAASQAAQPPPAVTPPAATPRRARAESPAGPGGTSREQHRISRARCRGEWLLCERPATRRATDYRRRNPGKRSAAIAGFESAPGALQRQNDRDQSRNPTRGKFQADLQRYLRTPSFRTDVLHRYLPRYENSSISAFDRDARYQPVPNGPNTNLIVVGTALLMLAVPVVYLIRGEQDGTQGPAAGGPHYPFRLPDSLATSGYCASVSISISSAARSTRSRSEPRLIRSTTYL